MPALANARHEAFSQYRAKGALLDEAFERAGFVLAKGHSSRLACRPEVAERIAEIRAAMPEAEDVTPQALMASLMRIVAAGIDSDVPAVLKEARLALVDVAKIQGGLSDGRRSDRNEMKYDFH